MAQGDFVHAWRINETASYLLERGFTVVTLQLPDELLGNATQLAGLLQAECQARGLAVQVRRAGGGWWVLLGCLHWPCGCNTCNAAPSWA